jgi:glycine/D-amino acid oxidase-like deaminating enzyme
MSAQQLGSWMLDQAKQRGTRFVSAAVDRIGTSDDRVTGVGLSDGSSIETSTVIDAAGPLLAGVARLAGIELPVHSEAHFKVAFRDLLHGIPRDAPMLIWCDPQTMDWSEEESAALAEDGRSDLVGTLPSFCHGRPEGPDDSPWFVALWEYHRRIVEPTWPMPTDDLYPEVVLRGMSTMIPELSRYREHMPQPFVDGGYYTKAPDNRPIVGPTSVDGFFLAGALSGFGIMASAAVGELAALHAVGRPVPEYAAAFELSRFDDPAYLAQVSDSAAGQL